MAYERKTNRVINFLKDLKPELQELGFGGTEPGAPTGNPYLVLKDGRTYVALAGGFILETTTAKHFADKELYEPTWSSSQRNDPYASASRSISPTKEEREQDPTKVPYTLLYYRVLFRDLINQIADFYGKPQSAVLLDHINHRRGDCTITNLQLATWSQNQRNRSKTKVTRAFKTLEDVRAELDSGVIEPCEDQTFDYIRGMLGLETTTIKKNKCSMSIYEAIKNMSKEELAAFLYANCEFLSAEYGQCAGYNNHERMLEVLDRDINGDW